MKTIILKTLALATVAAGQAYAAPISLDGSASITATYNPIASFILVDGSDLVSGMPGLTILGDHSIGLDLSGLAWTDGFGQFSTQLGTTELPEPANAALLLAGAAGLAAARRKRTSRT